MSKQRRDLDDNDKDAHSRAFTSAPPQVLSIAGSDPSGGAGIQADLKTFASLGCYGMAALTALTAQNTKSVTAIHTTPVDFFRAQLQALWDDVKVDAIKIGMLGNQDLVRATSEQLSDPRLQDVPVVLDPVMVSTSGSLLLTDDSINDLVRLMLPKCTLLTPNIPEAEQLLRHSEMATQDASSELVDMFGIMNAARTLTQLGPRAALVKGGHRAFERKAIESDIERLGRLSEATQSESLLGAEVFEGIWDSHKVVVVRTDGEPYADILQAQVSSRVVLDVLFDKNDDRFTLFLKSHVESEATHGTGCTLSSACAAHIAMSTHIEPSSLIRPVFQSIQYVQQAIARGLRHLGAGNGPLNHLCNITPRPIMAPTTSPDATPLCVRLISHSLPLWRTFTQHTFVKRLASSTLSKDSFVYFLRQDYLFLKHYARVWASGASSFTAGSTFERIGTFAGIAATMADEAKNHVSICEPWGITRRQLERETVESAATMAYTRFVLDVSRSGDALDLLAATGPCLLGYGEAGRFALKERNRVGSVQRPANVPAEHIDGFRQWTDYYAGSEFQQVVQDGIRNIERFAAEDPPSVRRLESLQRIWDAAIRLEIGMWDEALDESLRREVLNYD